jgi:hypothetical protein
MRAFAGALTIGDGKTGNSSVSRSGAGRKNAPEKIYRLIKKISVAGFLQE